MSLSQCRLDRFISQYFNISRRAVRLMLAKKSVRVDGLIATEIGQIIDKFSEIIVDNEILQANIPSYIMLNKPTGVVSATIDDKHKTVFDLLDAVYLPDTSKIEGLHIVGRLDLNTSGLILLTDNSRWSQRLTSPDKKVAKQYIVTLENKLTDEYIKAFEQGMSFEFEDITTRPAKLEIISDHVAQVTLVEGRYHQIKRMFGRFRNPVIKLHRSSIGNLHLDENLKLGESRFLTTDEVNNISKSMGN